MKKLLSVLLIACMLLSLSACFEAKPKDFQSNGMTITLTEEFKENTQEGYTVCYETPKVAVFALKEAFSLAQGLSSLTLDQYSDLVLKANEAKGAKQVAKVDGLTTMEYTFFNEQQNQTYSYFCVMFKASDAFWLIQFACKDGDYANQKDAFVSWAKTIRFEA